MINTFLNLKGGNRRKLAPIWSPGQLPNTPTPGNPVAPERLTY